MLALFPHEIRQSFASGEGKPSDAFNISAGLGRLFSFFIGHRKLLFLRTLKLPLVRMIYWALLECKNFEGPKEVIRNLNDL